MTSIALVSCVKTKRQSPSPAGDLYVSALFNKLRHYAVSACNAWYILSAEHGLLRPEQVIAPYETTLNNMGKDLRRAWAIRVQRQLLAVLPADAAIVLLAGQRYREGIEPFLRSQGFSVSVPLAGLSIGKQLQYLTRHHD